MLNVVPLPLCDCGMFNWLGAIGPVGGCIGGMLRP